MSMTRPLMSQMDTTKLDKIKQKAIVAQAQEAASQGFNKSLQPDKYPCFKYTTNTKTLFYIPNFTHIVNEETGERELNCDCYTKHKVKLPGSKYGTQIRCTSGMKFSEGDFILSGECPLCKANREAVQLTFFILEERWRAECEAQGLQYIDAKTSVDPKKRKEDFKKEISNHAVEQAGDFAGGHFKRTFPIVEFAVTYNAQGVCVPTLDVHGKPVATIKWYTIADTYFKTKYCAVLNATKTNLLAQGLEVPNTLQTIGGNWLEVSTLGITEPMKAATEFTVAHLAYGLKGLEGLDKVYDELAKDWTPAMAMDTVRENQVLSDLELETMIESAVAEDRELLANYISLRDAKKGVVSATKVEAVVPQTFEQSAAPKINAAPEVVTPQVDPAQAQAQMTNAAEIAGFTVEGTEEELPFN